MGEQKVLPGLNETFQGSVPVSRKHLTPSLEPQKQFVYNCSTAPTAGMIFENLWTVTETAGHLKVSPKTIYDWVHKRQIPFVKVNRLVRFRLSEIEKWLLKGGHYGN